MASKVLEKGGVEEVTKPKFHHTDLAMIEDELKPEYDVLNNLVKLVAKTKSNLEKISNENRDLHSTIDSLKSEMMGKKRVKSFKKIINNHFLINRNAKASKCAKNLER